MGLENRKKREVRNTGDISKTDNEIVTTLSKKKKAPDPTSIRFNSFDKSVIAQAIIDIESTTLLNISSAKFLKCLIRLYDDGEISNEMIIKKLKDISL